MILRSFRKLAGYPVECAIKAYIAKQIRKCQFPEGSEKAKQNYTHNLKDLIKVAGLSDQFQKLARLGNSWMH